MKVSRPVRLLSAILSALVALYGIVGFLVLPPILKPRIIEAIATSTHRDVALGDVAVYPYTLSLTLRDFRIKDPDGEALAGWDELYLNFEMRSLFHQAYTFSEISATAPFVSVRILSDGRLSVHDLLEQGGLAQRNRRYAAVHSIGLRCTRIVPPAPRPRRSTCGHADAPCRRSFGDHNHE